MQAHKLPLDMVFMRWLLVVATSVDDQVFPRGFELDVVEVAWDGG